MPPSTAPTLAEAPAAKMAYPIRCNNDTPASIRSPAQHLPPSTAPAIAAAHAAKTVYSLHCNNYDMPTSFRGPAQHAPPSTAPAISAAPAEKIYDPPWSSLEHRMTIVIKQSNSHQSKPSMTDTGSLLLVLFGLQCFKVATSTHERQSNAVESQQRVL